MWGTDRQVCCAYFHAQALRRFPAAARSWWHGQPAGEATPWQQWWEADVPVRWLALAVLLGSFLLAVLRNLAHSGWPESANDASLLDISRAAACALRSAAAAAASQLAAEATASLYDAWQTLLMFVAKTAVLALVYDCLWLAARQSCQVSSCAVGGPLAEAVHLRQCTLIWFDRTNMTKPTPCVACRPYGRFLLARAAGSAGRRQCGGAPRSPGGTATSGCGSC